MVLSLLLLSSLAPSASTTEIDVNGVAVDALQASGSQDDVELFIQTEAQVINTLVELDNQLDNALNELFSTSGSVEIDVVVGESDGTQSGSGMWIDDEIVVVIPAGSAPRLSEKEKDEIKGEIEDEVAEVLDGVIVDQVVPGPEVEQEPDVTDAALVEKIERLYEEEEEAEKELEQMEEELNTALDTLPSSGGSVEIDIVVSESNDENQQDIVDDQFIIFIPASTGRRPRLTDDEKQELEDEIVEEAADALGNIVMRDFIEDIAAIQTKAPDAKVTLELPENPRLEESSPLENALQQRADAATAEEDIAQAAWAEEAPEPEPKPVLRSSAVASAIAQPGFEHPMFVPHHWQTTDDQLWTMKLSMLTSISCVTLLLIVGVWTGMRRSRRHAVLDDNHFRWAERVEYMDAFPYEP